MKREGLRVNRLAGLSGGVRTIAAGFGLTLALAASAATDVSVTYDPLVDTAPVVSWTETDGAAVTAVPEGPGLILILR